MGKNHRYLRYLYFLDIYGKNLLCWLQVNFDVRQGISLKPMAPVTFNRRNRRIFEKRAQGLLRADINHWY